MWHKWSPTARGAWGVGGRRQEGRPGCLLDGILGVIVKPMALKDDEPMRRNSPTSKDLVVDHDRNLEMEQVRLRGLVERFALAGPKGCTTHPHSFFGRLTPEEWAVLMDKHLDHHLAGSLEFKAGEGHLSETHGVRWASFAYSTRCILRLVMGQSFRESAAPGKTFYIGTFGCQMNVHDSGKGHRDPGA